MRHILAVDMGGTRSRFAHFTLHQGVLSLECNVHCPTAVLKNTRDALAMAATTGLPANAAHAAVWAVAGGAMVLPLRCRMTNARLDLDLTEEGKRLKGLVRMVNDFEAQAFACLTLPGHTAKQCLPLPVSSAPFVPFVPCPTVVLPAPARQQGEHALTEQGKPTPEVDNNSEAQGVVGVLGVGTGLGCASLRPLRVANSPQSRASHWLAQAAEGGHVDFAFAISQADKKGVNQQSTGQGSPRHDTDKSEEAYARFARQAWGVHSLSAEHVLSGRGLAILHHFVSGQKCTPQEAAAELCVFEPKGSQSKNTQNSTLSPWWNEDEISLTGRIFARFLGRFCRHWALNTLCSGGLYISGGVAAKNPCLTHCQSFASSFYQGPPHLQDFLQAMPVYLMDHELAGIWGAARAAQQMLEEGQG